MYRVLRISAAATCSGAQPVMPFFASSTSSIVVPTHCPSHTLPLLCLIMCVSDRVTMCRRRALAVYPVLLMYVSIGWLALVKS
jgi:hypothetical protein